MVSPGLIPQRPFSRAQIIYFQQEIHLPKDKEHQVIKFLYGLPLSLKDSEVKLVLERAFSFYFVRHPFERLVSAFRDKIINTDYQHWSAFRRTISPNETEYVFYYTLEKMTSILYREAIEQLPSHSNKLDPCGQIQNFR